MSTARSQWIAAAGQRACRHAVAAAATAAATALGMALLSTACPRLAFAAEAAGVAEPSLTWEHLLAQLAQRRHGEADFQEQKYLATLDRPLTSSGVLIYQAPDHLEERILRPRAQSMVLDHGTLTMRVGTRQRSVRLADYPQLAPLIDSIRALLAGDRAQLEGLFELHFNGTLEHWQLRLQPRDARLASVVSDIDVQGEGDAIHEVQVHQTNGDHSIMRIQTRE